jgi:hypothetical protein
MYAGPTMGWNRVLLLRNLEETAPCSTGTNIFRRTLTVMLLLHMCCWSIWVLMRTFSARERQGGMMMMNQRPYTQAALSPLLKLKSSRSWSAVHPAAMPIAMPLPLPPTFQSTRSVLTRIDWHSIASRPFTPGPLRPSSCGLQYRQCLGHRLNPLPRRSSRAPLP